MSHSELHASLSQYGWNSISFQVLESGFHYHHFSPQACIAYHDTGGAWVVAGPPIAARDSWRALTEAAVQRARAERRRICFFAVEQPFVEATGLRPVAIGEQPVWDPQIWSQNLQKHRSLREQLRRARRHGVGIRRVQYETFTQDPSLRADIQRLLARWRAARPMAPMGFLVQVDPFADVPGRRFYVAWSARGLEGFLVLAPVYARHGWLFENLLRDPRAPNGTAELLIDYAMRDVAVEGATYATLGLAPLAGDVGPFLRNTARLARGLYDFQGLHTFKGKLRPSHWDRLFVAYPAEQSGVRAMLDVLRAFAPGGLTMFALRSLLRGPPAVLQLLTFALVPWTWTLAMADTARWFPAPWVQQFWVIFDACLTVGLAGLLWRWNLGLVTLLATAISLDASVTLVQALAFPEPSGWVGGLVKAIAVAAPSLAAVVLWNARRRWRVWQA